MEIGDKNVYDLIVNSADDRTVLEMLSVNKKFNKDEAFYKILKKRYPLLLKFKKDDTTWKHFYLQMITYISKLKEEYNFPYISNKKFNPIKFYKKIKKNELNIWQEGFEYAIQTGEINLIEIFINKLALEDIDFGIEIAIRKNLENILALLLDKRNSFKKTKTSLKYQIQIAIRKGLLNIIKILNYF